MKIAKPAVDYRRVVFINVVLVLAGLTVLTAGYRGARAYWWPEARERVLRVLCAEDWLDAETLTTFTANHGVRIDLYTYRDVAQFLRQMANSDGRVDVLCTSSLLIRSLHRSHWIRPAAFARFPGARGVAADFVNLPFDPAFTLAAPLHWTAFGFLSARQPAEGSVKQILARGRVGVWATELNYMSLLTQAGVHFEERLESEDFKRLEDEVQRFAVGAGAINPDPERADAADWIKRYEFVHVPLSAAAGTGVFSPAEDGGIIDVGLLAIGERSTEPALAERLIDALLDPTSAIRTAKRLGVGSVHLAAGDDAAIPPARRPTALRDLPLTKVRFPDVNAEATLKFSRTLARVRAQARGTNQ